MKKLYEKNELLFALLWIAIYCVVSIPIRGTLGDESIVMLIGLAAVAAGIFAFIKKYHLDKKYGLTKWHSEVKDYLYLIPMLILTTGNLWGVGIAYKGTAQIISAISMLFIGFIEELLFRGFLFRALLKRRTTPVAITISAVTFGIGHILNLFAGQGGAESLLQIAFAISLGFLFTFAFYKSGSLVDCIIVHGLIDVFSKLAATANDYYQYLYVAVTVVFSITYCLYLNKKPTALNEDSSC